MIRFHAAFLILPGLKETVMVTILWTLKHRVRLKQFRSQWHHVGTYANLIHSERKQSPDGLVLFSPIPQDEQSLSKETLLFLTVFSLKITILITSVAAQQQPMVNFRAWTLCPWFWKETSYESAFFYWLIF